MKAIIVHLSDIHFRDSAVNPICDRADAIAATLNEYSNCDLVVFAITGDIAFSGKASEYDVAREFFKRLALGVGKALVNVDIKFITVPGNHDCDFGFKNSVRDALLFSLKSGKQAADAGIVEALVGVQNNYWQFVELQEGTKVTNPSDKLSRQVIVKVGEKQIVFNCLNSAWMSELKEQQGTLLAPIASLALDGKSDLVVTLFHHPFNWLEAGQARQFREIVESGSDVICVGHEHEMSHLTQTRITGESNEIVEGGVLQGGPKSTFNHVVLDLKQMCFEVKQYALEGSSYVRANSSGIREIRRSQKLARQAFSLTPVFQDTLDDIGLNILHPRAARPKLQDLFCLPTIKALNTKGKSEGGLLSMEDLLAGGNLLILGPEKSGKTALLKTLVLESLRKGSVPILVSAKKFIHCDEPRVRGVLEKQLQEQFGVGSVEKFLRLPKADRILLVDDLRQMPLNADGRTQLLRVLEGIFDRVFFASDDLAPFGSMLVENSEPTIFLKSRVVQIKEMGHLRRDQLIRKWLLLGQEFSLSEDDLVRETSRIAASMNMVLLENVIPAYPITVLTLLQLFETQTSIKPAQGTYGYFYEMLITQSLSTKWKTQEVDRLYTFLSALAYEMFASKADELSSDRLKSFSREYEKAYAIEIDLERTIEKLAECRILSLSGGAARFRYVYLYHYFIARYFRDNLEDPHTKTEIQAHIERMAAQVYLEENANVLIFLSYLAKNPVIIDTILKNARELYSKYSWCDMDKDVSFATTGPIALPKFAVGSPNVRDSREAHLKRRDEISERQRAETQEKREGQHQELLTIDAAFKTLEILGQIVRNFSGSLKADVKVRLTEECYGVAFRTLRGWLAIIEDNQNSFKEFVGTYFRDTEKIADPNEVNRITAQLQFMLVQLLGLGVVKKLSEAVGAEDLGEIYSRVLNAHPTNSVELANIAIKLDHFRHTPAREIIDFHEKVEKKVFISTILKFLVIEHFYLFPVDRAVREKICDTLGIAKNTPLIVSDEQKKFKTGTVS